MNTNELHSLHSMQVLYDLQVKTQKKQFSQELITEPARQGLMLFWLNCSYQ